MTIHLRVYHPNDFEAVVQIWHESWHGAFPGLQHPWSYEQWRERFQQAAWLSPRAHRHQSQQWSTQH